MSLTITREAPPLKGKLVFERGSLDGGPPVWVWVALAASGAGVLYWFFSERKPRSMPLVLPTTSKQFSQMMFNAVSAVAPWLSRGAKLMIVAHAAYESGWGKATAFKKANNPFNLTTISGAFVPGGDTECDVAGNCRPITQKWALFPNINEGVAGYLKFIQAPRYTDAFTKLVNDDPSFIDSLRKGGYFTLPLEQYRTAYQSVLARVTRELSS